MIGIELVSGDRDSGADSETGTSPQSAETGTRGQIHRKGTRKGQQRTSHQNQGVAAQASSLGGPRSSRPRRQSRACEGICSDCRDGGRRNGGSAFAGPLPSGADTGQYDTVQFDIGQFHARCGGGAYVAGRPWTIWILWGPTRWHTAMRGCSSRTRASQHWRVSRGR